MKTTRIKKIAVSFVLIILISANIIAQTTTNPGDVWMYHKNPVWVGEEFIVEVHLNSGNQKLAAYGIDFIYDSNIINKNPAIGGGVMAGPDGFFSAPSDNTPGIIRVSGYDFIGKGPREDLYLLKIHFIAISPGTTPLEMVIHDLSNPEIQTIGTPNAINSSITILPAQEAGQAWLKHPYKVNYGMRLRVELHYNSGEQKLSAFGMSIQYDPLMFNVDTTIGSGGIVAGPDGFISAPSPAEGAVIVTGYDAYGTGPGEDLHIASVYFRAIQTGSTLLDLDVDNASDNSGQTIGTPNGMNSNIEIVSSYIKGDINNDWSINIVDALFVAQYYVGFIPLIDMYAADVTGDDEVNIIDALLIAQFYVGAITEFPADLNTPPVAHDVSATTVENESVLIDVLFNDTDVDGDVLVISNIGASLHGTATIVAGMIYYTPNADFNGTDSFSYTISDNNGGSDTGIVTVVVVSIPYYEVIDDYAEIYEDTSVIIDVLANDLIDESTYVESVGAPSNGSAVITENLIEYTPIENFYGVDSFIYVVADGTGVTDTAIVTVTVLPVNDPPVAMDDIVMTLADTAVEVDVLANDFDVDGDTLSIGSVSQPSNGFVDIITTGLIRYIPDICVYGITDSFTYTVTDGNGGFDTATVIVEVGDINCPYFYSNDDYVNTNENTSVIINVLENDSAMCGGCLELSIESISTPQNGIAVIAGDSIEYTPNAGFNGQDSFKYIATDSRTSDQATVTVIVNDPPVAGK